MRLYEQYEYAKEKCLNCGCRNKTFTPLYDTDMKNKDKCICGEMEEFKVGFQLICCNCGKERTFLTDYKRKADSKMDYNKLVKGRTVCFKPSPCFKKDCPLYGTCNDFWAKYGYDPNYADKSNNGKQKGSTERTNDGLPNIQTNHVTIEYYERERFH